jgi:hypothetical protein
MKTFNQFLEDLTEGLQRQRRVAAINTEGLPEDHPLNREISRVNTAFAGRQGARFSNIIAKNPRKKYGMRNQFSLDGTGQWNSALVGTPRRNTEARRAFFQAFALTGGPPRT